MKGRMTRRVWLRGITLAAIGLVWAACRPQAGEVEKAVQETATISGAPFDERRDAMIEGIHWIGHASFRLEIGNQVIYLDPWKVKQAKPADLILVTHGHHDHLSAEDIARIAKEDTVIVIAAPYAEQVKGDVRPIRAGQTLTIAGVTIEAVPSYNVDKPFHPRSAGNVGFIVEVGGRRIYHAGDTDIIPEMNTFRCDVALLPIGGKYTMDVKEAVEAVGRIKPQVAIPMHWGEIVGTSKDAEYFRDHMPQGVQAVLLTPEG